MPSHQGSCSFRDRGTESSAQRRGKDCLRSKDFILLCPWGRAGQARRPARAFTRSAALVGMQSHSFMNDTVSCVAVQTETDGAAN